MYNDTSTNGGQLTTEKVFVSASFLPNFLSWKVESPPVLLVTKPHYQRLIQINIPLIRRLPRLLAGPILLRRKICRHYILMVSFFASFYNVWPDRLQNGRIAPCSKISKRRKSAVRNVFNTFTVTFRCW